MSDIFDVKDTLSVAGKEHAYYSLPKLTETYEHIQTPTFLDESGIRKSIA